MIVYIVDFDGRSLHYFGTIIEIEFPTIKFLIKNLRDNDIFYDVGANYGFYTILAQEFITGGEIHSFEPNPNIFPLLYKNSEPEKFSNTF